MDIGAIIRRICEERIDRQISDAPKAVQQDEQAFRQGHIAIFATLALVDVHQHS